LKKFYLVAAGGDKLKGMGPCKAGTPGARAKANLRRQTPRPDFPNYPSFGLLGDVDPILFEPSLSCLSSYLAKLYAATCSPTLLNLRALLI
jgi:hypothetical protein